MTNFLSARSATSSSQQCFQLTYQTLEGYSNLLGRKIENHVTLADYHLHCCMYSTSTKQFIGRFCESMRCGLVESLQTGAVVCPIQESVFFHCSQVEPALLLITELTATFLSGSVEKCVALGWCMMPIFDRRGNQFNGSTKGILSGGGGRGDTVRLALYEGSPRMLLSITHPVADSKVLVPVPGCILSCSLRPHPTLAKASHLIPPKVIISYDDIIPGLIPTNVPEAFPKLMRISYCHLEKVSLLLLPSVDDFEEHLLTTLSDDLTCEGLGVDGSSPISIEERRLKVVLYNGWTLVGSPVIGYLDKVSPSAAGRTTGSFRGSTYGLRSNLILKGSLEITELVPHPLMEVVFLLEYVVGWSRAAILNSAPDTPTRRALANTANSNKPSSMHSTTLTLGWAVWQPFDPSQNVEDEPQPTQMSLELKSGPGFKPTIIPNSAHNACYQNNLPDAGKIAFKSIPTRAVSRMDGSQYFASSVNLQLEDAGVRKTPLRSALATGKDVPDSGDIPGSAMAKESAAPGPAVASTPLRKKATVKVDEEEAVDVSEPLPPAVEVKSGGEPRTVDMAPQGSFYPLSRSILAYFHSSGLEEFTDIKGNPLPLVATPTESSSLPSDALQNGPYRIAVQLLGFIMSKASLPSPPKRVNFTFHLYRYPPSTLRCSLTSPPTTKKSPTKLQGLPHLIRSVGGSGDGNSKKSTAVHSFAVSHQTLPTKADRSDFIGYLQCKHLVIDVYDGDSLIFIGSANIPLKGLLSPPEGSNYFQLNLCCPTFLSPSSVNPTLPPSSTLTATSSTPSSSYPGFVAGQLCLRLARLPPDRTETIGHERAPLPLLELCHPAPTTSSIARRLYDNPTWSTEGRGNEDKKTKERKLARMQKIRMANNMNTTKGIFSEMPHRIPLVEDHLNVIDIQREELERQRIESVLQDYLTSHYVLRPRMGSTVYFEHPFTNTHTHPLNVTISWKDPDLKLVTVREECQYLRNHFSINSTIDDNLITEGGGGGEGGQYGFFIHPGETVHLPFKYQNFSVPHSTERSSESGDALNKRSSQPCDKRIIKVYLQASHRDLLALLKIQVEPQRQRVDRVFHFYHPERTFIKKHFTFNTDDIIARMPTTTSEDKLFTCCSDPNAISEIKPSADRSSQTLYLKAAVKSSPSPHSLYVMLFNERHLVSPIEVWLVVLHPVCRVDHSVVIGQSSDVRLMVRGDHVNRRIACYSFSAPVMKVVTPSSFLLNTQSLSEVSLSLKSLQAGAISVIVTAVDMDSQQVIKAWMVCGSTLDPTITKAFQIALPTGGTKPITKAITFTNPYPKSRTFLLSTDQPSLVNFMSNSITLDPQETSVLSLQFSPSAHPLSANVLVFINDESDQTEECFLVKTIYSSHT